MKNKVIFSLALTMLFKSTLSQQLYGFQDCPGYNYRTYFGEIQFTLDPPIPRAWTPAWITLKMNPQQDLVIQRQYWKIYTKVFGIETVLWEGNGEMDEPAILRKGVLHTETNEFPSQWAPPGTYYARTYYFQGLSASPFACIDSWFKLTASPNSEIKRD